MNDDLQLEASWDIRKETLEECASHVAHLLRELSLIDPAFSKWHRMIGTKSAEESLLHAIDPTDGEVRQELARCVSRRDDGSVIEELGFRLRLWNGAKPGSIFLNVHAGAFPPNWPTFANDCKIELPYDGQASERVLEAVRLREIMLAVIKSLKPDVAWISSRAMWDAAYPADDQSKGEKVFGWLTYIAERFSPLPRLPDDYELTHLDGLGNLIVIKSIDRLTVSNPSHAQAIHQLAKHFYAAGLFHMKSVMQG